MGDVILCGKSQLDGNTEKHMVYDANNAYSYSSWTIEDRIAADKTQGAFLDLVVDGIESLENETEEQLPKIILDVGCGSAEVMEYVIKRAKPSFTHKQIFQGVDISPPMVEMAKKRFEKIALKDGVGCIFSIDDMHNLTSVADHSINFMYSCYVFQHSAHINELFNHLSKKLKNGCKLTFVTNVMEPKDITKTFPSGYLSNKWVPIKLPNIVVKNYGHTLAEWCLALEKSGFTWNVVNNIINDDLMDENYIYKDFIEVREVIIDATYVAPLTN